MRAPRSLLVPALALALCACRSSPAPGPPGPAAVPVPQLVRAVRARARAHDRAGAMRLLEADRPLDIREPERSWLITMLRPARCETARARRDALALPPSDLGSALRAVTEEDVERALARLDATRSSGAERWSDLAKAQLHARVGDAAGTLAAATRATESCRAFVRHEAHLLRGRVLLAAGELDAARGEARCALDTDPLDARVYTLRAKIHDRGGHLDDAVLARLAAVKLAPDSEGYARDLLEQLEQGAPARIWGAVDRALEDHGAHAGNLELEAVRGLAAAHGGRLDDAIGRMQSALARGAGPVPLERRLRQVLVARGRHREAYALLLAAVPPGVTERPENLRRPHWRALQAAVEAAPDARASPKARLALARAFVGVGCLEEAASVAERLASPDARALRRRVRGHLAFEAALREEIEAGYRAALRKEDPEPFGAVLERMRCLALRHLAPEDRPAFRRCGRALRAIPFLGQWLDHRTDTASPVVAHFRRYGRFLLFGQQRDGPAEAVVLSLASLTRAQAIRSAGGRYRHDVAIGYDRSSRAYITATGGVLGGACLADGVWLDADAARLTEHAIRRALARDPAYAAAVRASGPLRADTLEGPYALSDPGCTASRLFQRYVERRPDDTWGSFWSLQAHEHGHVADIRRHLPIVRGLPATIALLISKGFSPEQVEMELERRAQLGAVIDGPDPDFALAEMLLALPVTERSPEVHDGGYAQGLRQMAVYIATHPERFPQIDPRYRIVTQMDRLTNEQIRAAARAVLCR